MTMSYQAQDGTALQFHPADVYPKFSVKLAEFCVHVSYRKMCITTVTVFVTHVRDLLLHFVQGSPSMT